MLGSHNPQGVADGPLYEIMNYEVHPNFVELKRNASYKFDIAMTTTTEEINFNQRVKPICMPYHDGAEFHSSPDSSFMATVSGW